MPFIERVLEYSSLSIIGMDKNCGKTVVLNYILSRLNGLGVAPAVTSIGVDGEKSDIVTLTKKPEITLYEGTLFATASTLYARREMTSILLDYGDISTAVGDVFIAKSLGSGKIMLGGPSDTPSLIKLLSRFKDMGVGLTIVDGALSRKSLASPAVTEATILCTGAAYSLSVDKLVNDTKHTYNMMSLPLFSGEEGEKRYIHLNGMLTDSMLKGYEIDEKPLVVVVKDFTRIFVTREGYRLFISRGGAIEIEQRSNLVAICFNPVSPMGYNLNSELVVERLEREIGVKVYDVMRQNVQI